jgi:uncharacterized protein YjeT (DUF2065 family)
MLFWPGVAVKVLRWWVNLPITVLRVLGTLTIVLGLVCIVVTAMTVTAIAAVTLVLGTLWILAGLAYHAPGLLRGLAQPWTSGNPVWLRISGVVAVLIALALLLLYLR